MQEKFFGDNVRRKLEELELGRGRCVCGASEIATGDDGYCINCKEKKDDFIKTIIGSIDMKKVHETAGFESSEILILEKVRQFMIEKELSKIIDIHFTTHNNRDYDNRGFCEPYEDTSFLGLAAEKTQEVMNGFLNLVEDHHLDLPTPDSFLINMIEKCCELKTKDLNKAFRVYLELLKDQVELDNFNIRQLINHAFSAQADENKIKKLRLNYINKKK